MWTKLSDLFYDHPKVVRCSLAAIGLHAIALSYCSRHLTGGEVAKSAPFLRGRMSLAKELVRAGLWEKAKDGFLIHDWSDYNPTAQEAEDYQKRMREIHSLGGRSRAATASRTAGRFAPAGTSRTAVQQHQQATSPVPVPVPVPALKTKDKEGETPSLSANGQATTTTNPLSERGVRGSGLTRLGSAVNIDRQLTGPPDEASFRALFEEGRRETEKRRQEIKSMTRG